MNYLSSLAGSEKDDADTVEAENNRQEVANLNNTEMNRHYQRLVQEISTLSCNGSVECPSFKPSATQRAIENLTTPLPLTTMGQG
ncbi:hypothetical protein [Endozoicomonas sp. SESOKO2]|uniref:hypothetical protein n=1 Tax=Endozoicomonas sp. SESOKO2 TaxID=2828743 RepID=UPI002148E0AC|nr:hypothetical protein [Endozoicomonas sp. SESOKO2]